MAKVNEIGQYGQCIANFSVKCSKHMEALPLEIRGDKKMFQGKVINWIISLIRILYVTNFQLRQGGGITLFFLSDFNPIKGSEIVTKNRRLVKTRSLQLSEKSLYWAKKTSDKSLKIGQNRNGYPWMEIFVQLHSQIWFKVGLNNQKFSADSKTIRCLYMTSHDIL